MKKPSKSEAREWLRTFIEHYRAREQTIDLSTLSEIELAALMGGEKIKFYISRKK